MNDGRRELKITTKFSFAFCVDSRLDKVNIYSLREAKTRRGRARNQKSSFTHEARTHAGDEDNVVQARHEDFLAPRRSACTAPESKWLVRRSSPLLRALTSAEREQNSAEQNNEKERNTLRSRYEKRTGTSGERNGTEKGLLVVWVSQQRN